MSRLDGFLLSRSKTALSREQGVSISVHFEIHTAGSWKKAVFAPIACNGESSERAPRQRRGNVGTASLEEEGAQHFSLEPPRDSEFAASDSGRGSSRRGRLLPFAGRLFFKEDHPRSRMYSAVGQAVCVVARGEGLRIFAKTECKYFI